MMRLLDFSFQTPEENLALDEAILDSAEHGRAPDTLRFWESPTRFVVIGSGQKYREIAHVFNCLRDGVPIVRRCSAGGAVLQGPGCLNFSLALTYAAFPEVADLHGSYHFILDRVISALETLGITACRQGISDLTFQDRKFSGNAQRRRRNACLHHGTLLYDVNPELLARYLPEPKDRPEYRGKRAHAEFVGAIPADPAALRQTLSSAFSTDMHEAAPQPEEMEQTRQLAREKYALREWNCRR